MELTIASEAGNTVRQLSDVEREKVTRWVLETAEWTESPRTIGRGATMIVRGESFRLIIDDGVMLLCRRGIACRERATPVDSLAAIIEQ
jgi:hypothetical protein